MFCLVHHIDVGSFIIAKAKSALKVLEVTAHFEAANIYCDQLEINETSVRTSNM